MALTLRERRKLALLTAYLAKTQEPSIQVLDLGGSTPRERLADADPSLLEAVINYMTLQEMWQDLKNRDV